MTYAWDCRDEGCTDPANEPAAIVAVLIGHETAELHLVCDGCLRSAITDDEVLVFNHPGYRAEKFTVFGTHILAEADVWR